MFGTLRDFDELLAACTSGACKLVMDLVVNHTSDEHPWFVESRSSRTTPSGTGTGGGRPGTAWRAGDPGAEPNNWGSFFSGPAWEFDQVTGEYYLHLFSRKQPDLNWENPEVRQAVYAMMRWWLDRGVDGFRMDVINMISKDTGAAGRPVPPAARSATACPFFCGPRIHEFLQEMHREVFAGRAGRLLTVGEMPGVTVTEARLFTDPARGEVDMVFQFEHVWLDQGRGGKWDLRPLRLRDLKATLGRWQAGWPTPAGTASTGTTTTSRGRLPVRRRRRYRVRSAKLLATVLHLHRGTPYVYQGEELGMTNVPFAGIDDFRDIESLNHYPHAVARGADPRRARGLRATSRDNARTPMQWDARPAGFTTGTPWLAVNPNTRDQRGRAAADPDSVLHHYRRLIALRHTDPVVAHGDFTMLLPTTNRSTPSCGLRGHRAPRPRKLLGPPRAPIRREDAEAWAGAELVLGNDGAAPWGDLRPWEARIYRRHSSASSS